MTTGTSAGTLPGRGGFCSRGTWYTGLRRFPWDVVRLHHPLGAVVELLGQCHRDGLLLVPKPRAQPPLLRGSGAINVQRHVDS